MVCVPTWLRYTHLSYIDILSTGCAETSYRWSNEEIERAQKVQQESHNNGVIRDHRIRCMLVTLLGISTCIELFHLPAHMGRDFIPTDHPHGLRKLHDEPRAIRVLKREFSRQFHQSIQVRRRVRSKQYSSRRYEHCAQWPPQKVALLYDVTE